MCVCVCQQRTSFVELPPLILNKLAELRLQLFRPTLLLTAHLITLVEMFHRLYYILKKKKIVYVHITKRQCRLQSKILSDPWE